MKSLLFSLSLVLVMASCQELPLPFDKNTQKPLSDTTYLEAAETPQSRVVYVEKSTGVRCNACPEGDSIINQLIAQYPNRIAAVSLHNGMLATPYDPHTYDFRTTFGDQIIAALTGQAQPSGAINRKIYPPDVDYLLGRAKWTSIILAQKDIAPKVNLTVKDKSYSPATRECKFLVRFKLNEALAKNLNYSIMLTEGDLKETQINLSGNKDKEYKHKHVLRDMLTPALGSPLNAPGQEAGRVVEKVFSYTVPAGFVPENCDWLIIVHYSGLDGLDVLQAIETKLIN